MTEAYDYPQTEAVKAKKKFNWGRLITIVLALALAVVLTIMGLRLFIFERYKVDGISMLPTIESGSYVWVNKVKKPKRFDMVAIDATHYNQKTNAQILENGGIPIADNAMPSKLLKRVVGVAGDTLSVDSSRFLVVETDGNKEYLGAEDYGNGALDALSYWLNGRENFNLSIYVPDGYVFVLGDFRGRTFENAVSIDSRMFGLVAVDDIIGVAI